MYEDTFLTFPFRVLKRARMHAIVSCALLFGLAHAQTSDLPAQSNDSTNAIFSLSGFGTVGLAHSSEKRADFIANDLQLRGAGRNASWSAEVDTRIGVQLDARFNSQLSAVLQVTSEQRYDGSYKPELEWANVKYQITPDFSVRAGRIVLPTFLLSDSRKVGYASPWVRPPVEVYSLIPLTRSDGIDVNWRQRFGEVNNNVQVTYGRSSARIPEDEGVGGKVAGKNGFGISDTLEYGPTTVRFSYLRTDGTITLYKQLFDGYRGFAMAVPALAPQVAALINKYEPNNKPFSILTIGASYDPGKWFVMGEYGIVDTQSIYGKRSGWYVTSGYRIGKFTPYISYAAARLNSNSSDPGVSGAVPLNDALNEQLASAPVQQTASVGVRWDFAKNTALKIQYDQTKIDKGSPGSLDHPTSDFVPGGKFRVFSITADFLF